MNTIYYWWLVEQENPNPRVHSSSWKQSLQNLRWVRVLVFSRALGYKLFSCSTQLKLNTNFILLINTKAPTNKEVSFFLSLRCYIYHANYYSNAIENVLANFTMIENRLQLFKSPAYLKNIIDS